MDSLPSPQENQNQKEQSNLHNTEMQTISASAEKSDFNVGASTMKIFRILGATILILICGILLSGLSENIILGTDASEEATIGIKYFRGFPISFMTSASGYTWPDYNLSRFIANSTAWCGILGGIWIATRKIRRNKK